MFNNFLPKIVPLRDNAEKYSIAEQVTNDNAVHALCMLDN